jgi:hypothetical protein
MERVGVLRASAKVPAGKPEVKNLAVEIASLLSAPISRSAPGALSHAAGAARTSLEGEAEVVRLHGSSHGSTRAEPATMPRGRCNRLFRVKRRQALSGIARASHPLDAGGGVLPASRGGVSRRISASRSTRWMAASAIIVRSVPPAPARGGAPKAPTRICSSHSGGSGDFGATRTAGPDRQMCRFQASSSWISVFRAGMSGKSMTMVP